MEENVTLLNFTDSGFLDFEEQGHDTWTIVFMIFTVLTGLVGLISNITVVFLISGQRRLQNITNIYLLQRVIAEILILSMNPFSMVALAQGGFNLGYVFCVIYYIMIDYGIIASGLFLLLLAMDCYLASRPKHHSRQYRWKVLKIGSAVVWVFVALLAVPIYFTTTIYVGEDGNSHCQEGFLFGNNQYFVHRVICLFIFIFVPFIVTWIYVSLAFPPKTRHVTEDETEVESEEEGSASSLRSTLLALVTVVTVCQMPRWLVDLASYVYFNLTLLYACMNVFELCYAINPILCLWYRKDLRERLAYCLPYHRNSALLPLENLQD